MNLAVITTKFMICQCHVYVFDSISQKEENNDALSKPFT